MPMLYGLQTDESCTAVACLAFRDESPLYDKTFQPYGQIIVMNADGSDKTMLTDSMWEDSMPMYVWRSGFKEGK